MHYHRSTTAVNHRQLKNNIKTAALAKINSTAQCTGTSKQAYDKRKRLFSLDFFPEHVANQEERFLEQIFTRKTCPARALSCRLVHSAQCRRLTSPPPPHGSSCCTQTCQKGQRGSPEIWTVKQCTNRRKAGGREDGATLVRVTTAVLHGKFLPSIERRWSHPPSSTMSLEPGPRTAYSGREEEGRKRGAIAQHLAKLLETSAPQSSTSTTKTCTQGQCKCALARRCCKTALNQKHEKNV